MISRLILSIILTAVPNSDLVPGHLVVHALDISKEKCYPRIVEEIKLNYSADTDHLSFTYRCSND